MQISQLLPKTRLLTLALAGAGAVLFLIAGLPLPLLLGPMFACLVAALLGAPMTGTPMISEGVRPVLGVAVGASLTPELFGRMGDMLTSIMLIPPFVIVIGLIGYPYFRRCGFDRPTSYYCAMPGGLQDMAIFGEAAGGNVRALALVHTTRVLIIVSLMPVLLTLIWGLSLTAPSGLPAADVPLHEIGVMIVCGIVGAIGGARIGLFGAPIIGPMIVATAASMTGLLTVRPPAEAILFTQFFLGLGIGVKYVGITGAELRSIVVAAIGYCLILAVLSVVFAEVVIQFDIAPPLEAIMAFAPGGQAEMVLLAIIAGADTAYVITHHVLRVVVVILGAPIIARMGKD